MPWVKNGEIWVGRHEPYGLVVISKASMQRKGYLRVFFVGRDEYADCDPDTMREHTTGKNISKEDAERSLQAFLTVRNRELEENNRKYLTKIGKGHSGTRLRDETKAIRITHCFACKEHLDSSINLECRGCGWILCQCGACGCGFVRSEANNGS